MKSRRTRNDWIEIIEEEVRALPELQPSKSSGLHRRAIERWRAEGSTSPVVAPQRFHAFRARPLGRAGWLGAAGVVALLYVTMTSRPGHKPIRPSAIPLVRQPSAPVLPRSATGSVGRASAEVGRGAQSPARHPIRSRIPRPRASIVRDGIAANPAPGRLERSGPPAVRRATASTGARAERDDFVWVPPPRLVDDSGRQIPAALASYQRETAVVDARLTREVTLRQKAAALSDLCDHLRAETGIDLAAGASVADEKVTVLCAKRPLREIMRQLSRPFGYAWLRNGKAGEYRYELVQDLRSQLLEEELRNRDRNAALLALHDEMERYRPYLDLSPDEALARVATATPAEQPLLSHLAGKGWGPVQLYFRLSPSDLAALRGGQALTFAQEPTGEQRPLPPEVARGTLQSRREVRLRDDPDNPDRPKFGNAQELPDGVPPVSYPRARARVSLRLGHSELGQYTMDGSSTVAVGTQGTSNRGDLASGLSPAVRNPQNALQTRRWSREAALRARVTVMPQPSGRAASPAGVASRPTSEVKVSSADVLEALHRASGLPIVADAYTRLYPTGQVSPRNAVLFDALNALSDTMRLHWKWDKEGGWLQFRSASYYDDRLKEVPNRLLNGWSAARRQQGGLSLDNLTEIAQLTDTQLNSDVMAEGARESFDLQEWDLTRRGFREHLRYLAGLTPEQRRRTMSEAGLPFGQLSLGQQQQLMTHLGNRLPSLDALSELTIRVVYLQPGEFQWVQPGMSDWQGPERAWPANFFSLPTARERTREAVLQAARRIDPQADPAQIRPTELWLAVSYRRVDAKTGQLSEWGFAGTDRGGRVNW